jgi:hypothetical protein
VAELAPTGAIVSLTSAAWQMAEPAACPTGQQCRFILPASVAVRSSLRSSATSTVPCHSAHRRRPRTEGSARAQAQVLAAYHAPTRPAARRPSPPRTAEEEIERQAGDTMRRRVSRRTGSSDNACCPGYPEAIARFLDTMSQASIIHIATMA